MQPSATVHVLQHVCTLAKSGSAKFLTSTQCTERTDLASHPEDNRLKNIVCSLHRHA